MKHFHRIQYLFYLKIQYLNGRSDWLSYVSTICKLIFRKRFLFNLIFDFNFKLMFNEELE